MWLRVLSHVWPQWALRGGGCAYASLTKKLSCPYQDIEHVYQRSWEGMPFMRKTSGYSSSHINTSNRSSETEFVHIGRTAQNECAVIAVIGVREARRLYGILVLDRCITSYDCYKILHSKYKAELFWSSVKIRAVNGTFIPKKRECDVTFKINKERFTFPFLCLDQFSLQMITCHNFSKAYHIGMMWNTDDMMSLIRNGMPFAETLPTNDINGLVLCTWNLQHILSHCPLDILSVGCPGEKGNHTLARSCVFESSFK